MKLIREHSEPTRLELRREGKRLEDLERELTPSEADDLQRYDKRWRIEDGHTLLSSDWSVAPDDLDPATLRWVADRASAEAAALMRDYRRSAVDKHARHGRVHALMLAIWLWGPFAYRLRIRAARIDLARRRSA